MTASPIKKTFERLKYNKNGRGHNLTKETS